MTYRDEIECSAEEIVKALDSYDDTDWNDQVAETADSYAGHSTSDLHGYISSSRNTNAVYDQMGADAMSGVDSHWKAMSRTVYFAVSQDLNDFLSDMTDERKLQVRGEKLCEDCGEPFPEKDISDERLGREGDELCEGCHEDWQEDQEDKEEDEE